MSTLNLIVFEIFNFIYITLINLILFLNLIVKLKLQHLGRSGLRPVSSDIRPVTIVIYVYFLTSIIIFTNPVHWMH